MTVNLRMTRKRARSLYQKMLLGILKTSKKTNFTRSSTLEKRLSRKHKRSFR
jgi:hypothetical protein